MKPIIPAATAAPDGAVAFTGAQATTVKLEFRLVPGRIAAVRLEALPSPSQQRQRPPCRIGPPTPT